MHFCDKCECLLVVRELLTAEKKRVLYYICNNGTCDTKKLCTSFRISKKNYRHKLSDKNYLNKFKTKDSTLPIKKSTCPKCNKTNINKYERKYFRNQFFINHICSSCYHNW